MYSKEEKILIWLDIYSKNRKFLNEVINHYEDLSCLFTEFFKEKDLFIKFLGLEQYNKMSFTLNEEFIDKHIKNLENQKIEIVTRVSSKYPKQLLEIDFPPTVLYCKGDTNLLQTKCLSIIGTRKNTFYGKKITEKFAKALCNSFTIVSGMADGIDGISQRTTLENNGKTIAVIGSGFNNIYPKSNIDLFRDICLKGLVITEYLPDMSAQKYTFLERNRIVAGLSDGILITEAGLKSGTMSTRDFAVEYGKDIFVVPGNIDSIQSEGCNQILKQFKSTLVTCPNDILEKYNITYKPKVINHQLDINEQLIINSIQNNQLCFDEIAIKTKLDTKLLNTLLTTLQLRGIIEKLAGNTYITK